MHFAVFSNDKINTTSSSCSQKVEFIFFGITQDLECQSAEVTCRDLSPAERGDGGAPYGLYPEGSASHGGREAALCTTRLLHRDPTVRDVLFGVPDPNP